MLTITCAERNSERPGLSPTEIRNFVRRTALVFVVELCDDPARACQNEIQGDAGQRSQIVSYRGLIDASQHGSMPHGIPAVRCCKSRKTKRSDQSAALMLGLCQVMYSKLGKGHCPGKSYADEKRRSPKRLGAS